MAKKRGPRSTKARLAAETRCIYCASPPKSVEHMPPVWIFRDRQRPQGYEYACCYACNNGTRGADFAVGWFARLRPFEGNLGDPLYKEAAGSLRTLEQLNPGLRAEVFDNSRYETMLVERDGAMHEVIRVEADGPLLAKVLVTFGAKLGMALYREHIEQPLPLGGSVFVQPFMNGGLNQTQADTLLNILPGVATLRQGKREVSDQFAYAFNSDNRSIVMALASFHRNLHFLVLATSEPDTYRETIEDRFVTEVAPGQLLSDRSISSLLPAAAAARKVERFILPGLPRPPGR